jgi:hypothetical protein
MFFLLPSAYRPIRPRDRDERGEHDGCLPKPATFIGGSVARTTHEPYCGQDNDLHWNCMF